MKRFFGVLFLGMSLLITQPIFSFEKNKPNDGKFTVVLDAGHGGHDPGNLGNGFKEKDIALKIVLKVGAILEKHPDIKVIYTRDDDSFVDLYVRGKIANEAKADLFVSVHCNSHGSSAHGTETFVLGLHANKRNFEVAKKENSVIYLEDNYEVNYAGYDINSPESFIGLTIMQEEFLDQSVFLAKSIQDNFTDKLKRVDRGVKQAGFIVLHQTFMPSVLVETGFLTYKPEGSYLNSNKGKSDMATSIADAIFKYKKHVEENIGDDFSFEVKDHSSGQVAIEQTDVSGNSSDVVTAEGVTFRVQIAAGSSAIETKAYNFKGLSPISREKEGSIYRYYYGEVTNYDDIKRMQQEAISKGYKSSFVVAFKNGEKVKVKSVLNSISN
ncbi:N-acetylmuramoyl-L-alanine amidase [Galbibacter pacificus]|uniref:N-acetylmuramoyl-L-alanine amidase n=1 Tax=Galbibacter pacificus TaxID=2996052 RepID=A0ABT6FPC0_9FLAO|nr:N-acetylmuramoyl-L-alanine amidase [Galbibacter pacificus]MDG3581625.1 N-acetylmuramoyl-L-alanine amidase [Galbibacter pacificus]MDG3585103.1 N-acetylmuramoyl-L-alanine amidase [Galbibacter pacificus]